MDFINKLSTIVERLESLVRNKNEKYNYSIFQDIKIRDKVITIEDRVLLRIIEKLERIKSLDKWEDRKVEYEDIAGYIINLLVANYD